MSHASLRSLRNAGPASILRSSSNLKKGLLRFVANSTTTTPSSQRNHHHHDHNLESYVHQHSHPRINFRAISSLAKARSLTPVSSSASSSYAATPIASSSLAINLIHHNITSSPLHSHVARSRHFTSLPSDNNNRAASKSSMLKNVAFTAAALSAAITAAAAFSASSNKTDIPAAAAAAAAATAANAPNNNKGVSAVFNAVAACKGKFAPAVTTSAEAAENCNCGEDAFFVAPSQRALGVADGVGGWSSVGVDPAEFSWKLMRNAQEYVEQMLAHEKREGEGEEKKKHHHHHITAVEVIEKAYQKIVDNQEVKAGSSTACVVLLRNEPGEKPTLTYANIGDSAFMLIRRGEIVFRTREQQHYFNAPYQIGVVPEHMREGAFNNKPSDADTGNNAAIEVQEGDILVLGTDGVFDNVFDSEILELIKKYASASADHQHQHQLLPVDAIAKDIVMIANKHARDVRRNGPFAINARRAGYFFTGGKVDDITAVVAQVVAPEQPHEDSSSSSSKQQQA